MPSFLHFSPSEVESGLEYAQRELHTHLNREMLRDLANRTGIRWATQGKKSGGVLQAKRIVLADLWEKHRIDKERRDAYSSAISHMFGQRNAARNRKPRCGTVAKKAQSSPPPANYGFGESGQGVFLFGKT